MSSPWFTTFRGGANHLVLIALTTALVGFPAQAQLPPASGEVSHASYARELIPVLLGRRAHGVAEVAMVARVSELKGREAAARMLMQETEFVTHWADALIDVLDVRRGTGSRAHRAECYGAPLRNQDDGGGLAAFVRDHPPQDSMLASQSPTNAIPALPFNMIDLIRSAIELDDLSPIYQAYLFSITGRAGDATQAGDEFMRTFLNRDFTCLRCHNSTFSISNKQDSDGNIVWRRLWSIPANIEKALFGNYTVVPPSSYRSLFRPDVRVDIGEGIVPWGMEVECTSGRVGSTRIKGAFASPTTPEIPSAHFGSIDGGDNPFASVLELERTFRAGVAQVAVDGLVVNTPPPSTVATPRQAAYCAVTEVVADTCAFCHSGASPLGNLDLAADLAAATVGVSGSSLAAGKTLITPESQDNSELFQVLLRGEMPLGSPGLSPGDLAIFGAWIDAGATSEDPEICSSSHVPDVAPDPAFAFQVAMNAVDRIWQRVMGERLTIDHGFARNEAQLEVLWTLTDQVFLPGSWSLADLLVAIVTSDYFLRRAPAEGGTTPYPLPMLVDPWVEADPTQPPPSDLDARQHNGPGDLVHRHWGGDLVWATSSALGWKLPSLFPPAGEVWPNQLSRSMGRYESPSRPGFDDVDFQTLLLWENTIGVCTKVDRVEGDADWIDHLLESIAAFNVENPGDPITLTEAYLLLKDWLLQDPTLASQLPVGALAGALTEEQALYALLNAELLPESELALGSPTTQASDGYLETKLREACGVLLKNPSFMLARQAPASYATGLPPDPRMRVCNEPPCDRQQMCESFSESLQAIGQPLYCAESEFTDEPPPAPVVEPEPEPETTPEPEPETRPAPQDPSRDPKYLKALQARGKLLQSLCPSERCAFLAWKQVEVCERKPYLCRKPPVRYCDPLCSGPRCCGALPNDPRIQGLLTVAGVGALVQSAQAVTISRLGTKTWAPLEARTRLRAGDLLRVPLDGQLLVKDRTGTFGTPLASTRPERPTPRKPFPRPSTPATKARLLQPTKRPTLLQKRGVPHGALAALMRPIVVNIVGKNQPLVFKRGESGPIDRRTLRAQSNRERYQSRASVPKERERLVRRAARRPPRDPVHISSGSMTFERMHEEAAAPEPLRRSPPIQLELSFRGGGSQSLFCPGSRARHCTPSCQIALQKPQRCDVLGEVAGRSVSGEIKLSGQGRLDCIWKNGKPICRIAQRAPRKPGSRSRGS